MTSERKEATKLETLSERVALWERGSGRTIPAHLARAVVNEAKRVVDLGDVLQHKVRELTARVAELETDCADETRTRERLHELLRGVAVAIRGPEPELTMWSFHDLPERAKNLVAEVSRLRALVADTKHERDEARREAQRLTTERDEVYAEVARLRAQAIDPRPTAPSTPGEGADTARKRAVDRASAMATWQAHRCVEKWSPFAGPHEVYGVIREELEEFFDEVRKKSGLRSKGRMRAELIDIACAALRAAGELE